MLAAQVYSGYLNDKIVYTSAGHGWDWSSGAGRYATGRPEYNEIIEDFGNQDQLTYYAEYLLRAGATVVPMRPIGNQTREIVLDNDSAGVTFSGSWTNTSSGHHYDEDYGATADSVRFRFSSISATETATATYQPNFAAAGFYPVYTWALSGTNRTDQLYRINHTGGTTEVRVDHRLVGKGWVYLGTYYFDAGSGADGNVQISNQSTAGGSVAIADAIRFGNGMGDFTDSGAPGPSGYSREDENSYKWLRRAFGVGSSSSATTVLGTSNVHAPSEMAEWMNSAPFGQSVYIGFHSNGTTGDPATATARGAIGLIDSDQGTPNQSSLALYTGRQINQDLLALSGGFEHSWTNRTTHTLSSGFGEIDLGAAAEMDATIVEVGYHDTTLDALLLRDPKVREQIARSTYEATLEYFDNFGGLSTPVSQPNAPLSPRATANADGSITLSWTAPAARTGGAGAATGYVVYRSGNGYGFGDPIAVGSGVTSFTIPAAQVSSGANYFKVAATNAGGESPASAVVAARRNGAGGGGGTNRILVVNGFDRYDRTQNFRQAYPFNNPDGLTDRVRSRYNNTFDYLVQAGEAIEAYTAGGVALGFDSAQNEHVISGAFNLGSYQTVIWLSGEESTADETFNASEQSLVSAFLGNGGRLFVSGAEIGWDLDRPSGPTAGDRSFYNNTLKADYQSDDAGTYNVGAASGSIFAGLANFSFDNGLQFYDAEFPDRILPTAGSGATAALNYVGGLGSGAAAIQWASVGALTGPRLVNFAFPFETITTAANRAAVMERVLNFFQTAVSATPATPDLDPGSDSGASNTDNVTNRDNSSIDKRLTFTVTGTVAGATVRIYHGNTVIGTATATGTTTVVTTGGGADLADGTRPITATQQEPNKSESAVSAVLNVFIDTVAPAAPAAPPDLAAGSDTGTSDTDDLTNDTTPTLTGSFPITPTAVPTMRLYANGILIGTAPANGAWSITSPALADGVHAFTSTLVDAAGNESAPTAALGVTINTTAPTVTGYTVNDGHAQRSKVNSVTVSFNRDIFLENGAVTLTRRGDGATLSGGAARFEFGSLEDGVYDLTVDATKVTDVYGNRLTTNGTFAFHRLFGDGNGDGFVDSIDSRDFRGALGSQQGQPNYVDFFDFNGDGFVDSIDSRAFRARLGSSLQY